MEDNNVNKDVCAERHNTINKELARHEEMLEKYTDIVHKQSETDAQIGELLKNSNKTLENHESRITSIEKKPNAWLDKLITWVGSGIVMGIISFIFYTLNLKG